MLVMGAMEQSLLPSVDLGEMLLVMADRTEQLQKLLVQPRSVVSGDCSTRHQWFSC
jgi:hypothetical protein